MYYQRQQRRRAVAVLAVGFFIFATIGYLLFSIQSLDKNQQRQFQELEMELTQFKVEYEADIEEIRLGYDAKLESLGNVVVETQREYTTKTKDLVEFVEKTEARNQLEVEELRQELNAGPGLSQLVSKVVKGAVGVSTDNNKGSGAVLSKDGYIVTNNHVVAGDIPITVIDYFGRISDAQLILSDPVRDLAIIKIPKTFDTFLRLGDSDKVLVAESVIAIGSPKGLDFTVTQGIVSANHRLFSEDEGEFIQTDVPINPGSSGGPLINMEGRLIGINTFKLKGSESLGFSIPSNDIKKIYDEALAKE